MAKPIILTQKAISNINEILQSVVEYTGFESSAIRLNNEIYEKIESIGFMPAGMGRKRDDGLREAFVRRYRIVYQELPDAVLIVAVIHSSRLYPNPSSLF